MRDVPQEWVRQARFDHSAGPHFRPRQPPVRSSTRSSWSANPPAPPKSAESPDDFPTSAITPSPSARSTRSSSQCRPSIVDVMACHSRHARRPRCACSVASPSVRLRRLRPRRFVCQLAPLHGCHSPGRSGRGPLAARPSDSPAWPGRWCPLVTKDTQPPVHPKDKIPMPDTMRIVRLTQVRLTRAQAHRLIETYSCGATCRGRMRLNA